MGFISLTKKIVGSYALIVANQDRLALSCGLLSLKTLCLWDTWLLHPPSLHWRTSDGPGQCYISYKIEIVAKEPSDPAFDTVSNSRCGAPALMNVGV